MKQILWANSCGPIQSAAALTWHTVCLLLLFIQHLKSPHLLPSSKLWICVLQGHHRHIGLSLKGATRSDSTTQILLTRSIPRAFADSLISLISPFTSGQNGMLFTMLITLKSALNTHTVELHTSSYMHTIWAPKDHRQEPHHARSDVWFLIRAHKDQEESWERLSVCSKSKPGNITWRWRWKELCWYVLIL